MDRCWKIRGADTNWRPEKVCGIIIANMELEQLKAKISDVAEKYRLKFVILYGSRATGKARPESDIDIAVLGRRKISPEELLNLIGEFCDLFNTDNVDVKSLHNANIFFAHQATYNGILLYGDEHQFNLYKIYNLRSFQESKILRRLRDALIRKRQEHLNKIYARYA